MQDSHTTIIPYQESWIKDYEKEKGTLLGFFGTKILNIEHIGSTSINELQSKPIIDIAIIIKDFEPADNFNEVLKGIGYTFNSSSTERHFYTKGNPIKYHLSIGFADRGGFWVRQILFRDYLRNHDNERKEYGNLKKSLLKDDPSGLNSYISGKSDFIGKILKLANWKENQTYSDYISQNRKNSIK